MSRSKEEKQRMSAPANTFISNISTGQKSKSNNTCKTIHRVCIQKLLNREYSLPMLNIFCSLVSQHTCVLHADNIIKLSNSHFYPSLWKKQKQKQNVFLGDNTCFSSLDLQTRYGHKNICMTINISLYTLVSPIKKNLLVCFWERKHPPKEKSFCLPLTLHLNLGMKMCVEWKDSIMRFRATCWEWLKEE